MKAGLWGRLTVWCVFACRGKDDDPTLPEGVYVTAKVGRVQTDFSVTAQEKQP